MPPVRDEAGETACLLSNPFDWELLDILKRYAGIAHEPPLIITEPAHLRALCQAGEAAEEGRRDTDLDAAPAGSDLDARGRIFEAAMGQHPVGSVASDHP